MTHQNIKITDKSGFGIEGIIEINGQQLNHIKSISFNLKAGKENVAFIEMIVKEIDIEATGAIKTNGIFLNEGLKRELFEQLQKEFENKT